ncbi:fatty acid desaturase [Enhygromyxa salina]|uniref:Fatty acid desaturase n=1 Tax=Enhygromyxa salina TaxID=215803 RepID=A0A2S9YJ67_9BACT|nr:fatty acid desaturase [Enhygromyxa salina]PRQ05100.1 Fatty acid desaturase [Enhygromyxa salina]
MDAILIDEPLLASERLKQLSQRSDAASLRRLLAQTLLYVGSAVALVLLDDPAAIVTSLLINGVAQFAMFGMLHEACHKTAFARPWLSELAGWIAALAQPMSPALMRAFHFTHHRHTHELEHDPELGGLAFMIPWPRGLMWVVTMTGIPLVVARVGWSLFAALVPRQADGLWTRVLPFVRPERRLRIAWEARLLMLIHGLAIAAACTIVPTLWRVYAGLLIGHMLLGWYTTCEHRGLPALGSAGEGQPSILARTRSLVTPAWLRWLIWNMPYHAEHHAWPAVPWHALPALHEQVRGHLVHRERPLYLHLHGGRERPQPPRAD